MAEILEYQALRSLAQNVNLTLDTGMGCPFLPYTYNSSLSNTIGYRRKLISLLREQIDGFLAFLMEQQVRTLVFYLTTSTGVLALFTTAFVTPPVRSLSSLDLPLDPITIMSKLCCWAYPVITPASEMTSSSSTIHL
jgi:hypothetical protein